MASCKFEKGKCKGASDAKAHMRHNDISPERREIASKGNKHIDTSKSKYNFSILGLSYEECAAKYDARIAYLDTHGNKNKRKDRVTMQIIEIPVPANLPRNQYKKWFIRVSKLLREKYGEENFIEGSVHYDEEHEYRHPETMELVWSRVHAHYMIIPAVDGKLNAKQISLRKNMKALNREVDQMTQAEFGCNFMDGSKRKSVKSVEELKQQSEYAEMFYQLDQQKKELDELEKKLRFQQDMLLKKLEEIEERERELTKREEFLECDEGKVWETLQMIEGVLEECESLRDTYRKATEHLKNTPTEIPQKEFMEELSKGLRQILSGFNYKEGTLWEYIEKPIMGNVESVVNSMQSRMPGAVLKGEASSVARGEESVSDTMRKLKARELPLDEETFEKWENRHVGESVQMGL